MTKLQKIAARATDEIQTAKADIAKFAERLANDPAYAFEWGQDAVDAVGWLTAWSRVEASVGFFLTAIANGEKTEGEAEAEFQDALLRMVVTSAGDAHRSTSPMSNMVKDAAGRAYVKALDKFMTGSQF